MRDLVDMTIEAHGGLAQWREVRHVSADFVARGPSFAVRGPVGVAVADAHMRLTVNTRKQEVWFDGFLGAGNRGVYEPHRSVIKAADGAIVEVLDDPRGSLTKKTPGTPWSGPQLLYFLGYSLWMYIALPYAFRNDGVVCEEIEPLVEDGETWRALKVTYPSTFPSHSTQQTHYFDEAGRMRRQDYTVDVRSDLSAAHYMLGHQKVDGFLFATQRRIFRRAPDGVALKDQPLIFADFADFTVTRDAGR